MHLEHEESGLKTEADVETKVLAPLLLGAEYLGLDSSSVFSKGYLAPAMLDKAAGKVSGYFPDYSVWISGFIVMVVEAKAPVVQPELGYREASLYARHINQQRRTGLNPCHFIIACNGRRLLAGYDDAQPSLDLPVAQLQPETTSFQSLVEFCGRETLVRHASECLTRSRVGKAHLPYVLAGGPSILTARKPLNSFAPELSPILRKYFSTSDPAETREVVEKAYVSTAEITEYDRVLEALLKDRSTTRNSAIVQDLSPTRKSEPRVAEALGRFAITKPPQGQLQIIQGAVGAGKSIFIRRYKEFLQPPDQRARNRWAFVDFLGGPPSLKGPDAQRWMCETFRESFQRENPDVDISSPEVHRGIYSRQLQRRKPIYDDIGRDAPEQAARLRAEDLVQWQDDPEITARGLADYALGSRQDVLVTVMDNVDKLGLAEQLNAFELSLWFLALSRCFVVLQMRDETYERYKDAPPLDTYRSSVTFHITPPRFIDVVKRRLDLGVEYLLEAAASTQTYSLDSGVRVTFPKTVLGQFLHQLYTELFGSNRNVARLVESLAGLNVRRALEIFSSLITSGHLSTNAITSTVRGGGEFPITEIVILKILMRTGYRIFSANSGFITNIFYFDEALKKPDNFILVECLFFLARMRGVPGQIGLQGFFTCEHVASQLQILGYVKSDILVCLNHLLKRELISADHQSVHHLEMTDAVKILPSGFMHLRVLPENLEYSYGVIPTTPIVRLQVAQEMANIVEREVKRDDLTQYDQTLAVEKLYNYLLTQLWERETNGAPQWSSMTGAEYVIERMRDSLTHYWGHPVSLSSSATDLDEV